MQMCSDIYIYIYIYDVVGACVFASIVFGVMSDGSAELNQDNTLIELIVKVVKRAAR